MTDTITIPRDLFERLCNSAIEAEVKNRWMSEEYGNQYFSEYDEYLRTMNEAVAIRDGGK